MNTRHLKATTVVLTILFAACSHIDPPVVPDPPEPTPPADIHDPEDYASGTLPMLVVNTVGNAPITSKEEYVSATYYLDAKGIDGIESIGTADSQLAVKIRERGNASRLFDKKPYRIKLGEKAPLLGMNKSKHFVLLANVRDVNFAADNVGFMLSRLLKLDWTPNMHPIELVVNGDYKGLYYLCEQIRVDKKRVNITEQDDGETDPEKVSGGWLVEIDNYNEDGQITIPDRTLGNIIRFTSHSPENLSPEQRLYLTNLVTTIDSLIYDDDKSDAKWSEYVDADALARFYILQEVMDNCESFSGSCYWHKERGNKTKIVFGPVWDFGGAYSHWECDFSEFIYNRVPSYCQQHWIGELAKFDLFQEKAREVWHANRSAIAASIFDFIDVEKGKISEAIKSDKRRWPQYDFTPLDEKASQTKAILQARISFLDSAFGMR